MLLYRIYHLLDSHISQVFHDANAFDSFPLDRVILCIFEWPLNLVCSLGWPQTDCVCFHSTEIQSILHHTSHFTNTLLNNEKHLDCFQILGIRNNTSHEVNKKNVILDKILAYKLKK